MYGHALKIFTVLCPNHASITGQIWDRAEIRPFSPVYTRIRPVKASFHSGKLSMDWNVQEHFSLC